MDPDRAPAPGDFDLEDPNLEEKLVNELKAQGIFDQFRKDCLSDVDTKPAYQNLRVRVDKSVSNYLSKTTWRPTLNKNQLRNQLRRYIQDMSGVEAGVDRIVDQIVNPKLNSTFLPEVETVIYNCFGTTKPEDGEEDLLNGNDEPIDNGHNGDADHEEGGVRKLSTDQVSDADMVSVSSSPGPGLAGHVSPLTPGASPSVAKGDISPLTPAGSPPPPGQESTTPAGTPPPPPPGESPGLKVEEQVDEMDIDMEEEISRPQSAYTPPLPVENTTPIPGEQSPHTPPPPVSESPSYTPPPADPTPPPPGAATPNTPPPPAPPTPAQELESGGEASMSSISDTDLGDVSPPRPAAAPAPATPPPQPAAAADQEKTEDSQSGSDDDLAQLMKMKAELMAQLEGDFKLSPEEDSDDDDDNIGGETVSSDAKAPVSSTSESPSPPPGKKGPVTPGEDRSPSPPGDGMAKLSVSEGCKPFSDSGVKSPGSGGSGSGGGGQSGPSSGGQQPPASGSSTSSNEPQTGGSSTSSGGDGQKSHKHRDHHHSSSSKSHHSSSKHSSGRRHSSSGSMSKEEKKKMDKLKEQQKAKIEKYEEKIKSRDKMKSDKFQALDIFSNTKKPSTPYQPLPHKAGTGNNSGSNTPTGIKPPKKDFEKKLDEAIKKELERREEEKKKKHSFKTPMKLDERRSSSDKERSSEKIKDRRSSHESSSSRDKHRDRHDSDKHRRSSSDKERRHSSSSSHSSSSDKKDYKRREEKESKYSKEKEQQELESKRRLQEAREKREREEKEKKRQAEKEREKKQKEASEKKKVEEKTSSKSKDEVNDLLKQRITSLGADNIQKLLMESLVENTGAKISQEEKTRMISKMKDMLKTETSQKLKDREKPVSEKKKSPVKKRTVSSSSSSSASSSSGSSSSDSESDDAIKEMKAKSKARRLSTETSAVRRPVRNRKVRTFEDDDSDKSDTDSDFIQSQELTIKSVETVKEDSPKQKSAVESKPAFIPSPPRVKKDVDPNMPIFNSFTKEEVEKATKVKEKFDKLLTGLDEETIVVNDVTEAEINAALPSSRIVTIDADDKSEEIIKALGKFGGNPRLFTPVPDWLIPYLKGAKVKLEDVEMPSMEEIVEYLGKKQSGKRKRKAGWDIVVDWVPDVQPETKRSKLEKQLGFDFDSSFGCSISSTEGRRARRSNVRYSDVSTASETGDNNTAVEKKPKRCRVSLGAAVKPMEVDGDNNAMKETPDSPPAAEDRAEHVADVVMDTEEQKVNAPDVSPEDGSPSKKRRSRDIIAAYLNSAGVERVEATAEDSEVVTNISEEKPQESSFDPKETLAALDAEINETDQELETVLKSLKGRRKRSQSGDTKFHGWTAGDIKVPKTASINTNPEEEIDQAGASFGLTNNDLVRFSEDNGASLLEVIFSAPILNDVKKLETNNSNIVSKTKKVLETEADDRGASSPDSYGSSKENDPEMCNNVFNTSKGYSTRKRNSLKPALKKPALAS